MRYLSYKSFCMVNTASKWECLVDEGSEESVEDILQYSSNNSDDVEDTSFRHWYLEVDGVCTATMSYPEFKLFMNMLR